MRREQVANPAKPCQKRHDRHGVEPGKTAPGMYRSATRHSAGVMRAMKRQVPAGGKMDMRRTAEKRQHAEDKSHEETEKIKIRPGHTTPRAQPFTSATCRCGARAGIRDAGPANCYLDPLGVGTAQLRREAAADDRCPSVLRCDDCPDARLLRGARLNRVSGESPPGAKSHGASPHAPRWLEAHVEEPDRP